MPTESMVGIEALLEHERWVRWLARALVRDDDDADDLVQEVRVTSWQRPPRDPERAVSWLGTVLRNRARNRKRDEITRQRIESQAAITDEAVPSAESLAERLETHRRLADAVSGLAEPFRQIVLLRYYNELSCSEIARRLGLPAGTVRWRLKTGLERLRAALDEQPGGRQGWMAALVPLAAERSRPVSLPARAERQRARWSRPLALAAGVLAVAAAGVVGRHHARPATDARTRQSLVGAGAPSGPPRVLPASPALTIRHADVSPRARDLPGWVQLEGAAPRTIAGHVLSNGRPLAGARVRLSSATLSAARTLDRHTTSNAEGAFAFAAQPISDWLLTVWAPGLEPAIHILDLRQATADSRVNGHPIDALVIELDRCRVFARGTVRDRGGGVIASAHVRFGASWDGGGTEARSDESGRYELCLPANRRPPPVLTAEASGYGTVEAAMPPATGAVDFQLEPQAIISGRALSKVGGAPVPGVDLVAVPLPGPEGVVGVRRASARRGGTTDDDGRFELTGLAPGRYELRFASDQVFGATEQPLTVGPSEQVRGIEVRMRPVALVEGTALRASSLAAGAELRFVPAPADGHGPGVRRTRSDDQGRFRVRVPDDMPLAVQTLAAPDRSDQRWIPVLTPATLAAGRARLDAARIELPPTPNAEASDLVTPAGGPAPPPTHALEGQFGDRVRILGYDLARNRVARGDEVEVTLHFQVLAPLEGWRLFSHLVGPGGLTNLDHAPAEGAHPVTLWRTGETIRDRFSIRIPAELSPGRYTLLTGFWSGKQRLPITPAAHDDGESRFQVLTVTVE